MKPGFKTTEFWLALAGFAFGAMLVLRGEKEIGGALIAAASLAAYGVSRGMAKRGVV